MAQEGILTDFDSFRFSYESNLLKRIESKYGPVPLRDYAEAQNLLESRRRNLLGDAVEITQDLLPEVHGAYGQCLDLIGGGIGLKGRLFVQQSSEYNASVFASSDRFDVLIHSSLLNDFDIGRLKFVFGHELGHVVFGHSRFPVNDILANINGIPQDAAEMLLRWSRATEISADRIGMLCCGNLGNAACALFQTSSGLKEIDENRILRSFRKQYSDLEYHIKNVGTDNRYFRTHPMIPIRFKALELGSLDIIALRRQAAGFSWKGFQHIDRQIAFLLESLDIRG
ncbi:M48 family metallopeptidase [Desulfobacterales bacterium HSG16]|nr:M48 family metallopeptidase [Desulfobacterales bacterium HSG16]